MLAWLSVWSKVQMTCIWSSWCHCHPIISASAKSRMVYPCDFQAVLEKRPLNDCVCLCVCVCVLLSAVLWAQWVVKRLTLWDSNTVYGLILQVHKTLRVLLAFKRPYNSFQPIISLCQKYEEIFSKCADHVIAKYAAKICGNRPRLHLSLIHIWRCRRIERCRSRWSPYH